MTIKKFDRASAGTFHAEAEQALKALAEKHGLTVERHGGTIEPLRFVAKFTFTVNDPEAAQAEARKTFDKHCAEFGMTPAHFGAVFVHKNATFRVSGLDLGSAKYPIQAARDGDGKVLWFPEAIVSRLKITAAVA